MTIRYLCLALGISFFAAGTVSCMGRPSQDDVMAMLVQAPEAEARSFIYEQFDPEIQRSSEAFFGSFRSLAVESVLAYLVAQQEAGWTKMSVLTLLGVMGLVDIITIPSKAVAVAQAISARETVWKRILGMRNEFVQLQERALEQQSILDQATDDE